MTNTLKQYRQFALAAVVSAGLALSMAADALADIKVSKEVNITNGATHKLPPNATDIKITKMKGVSSITNGSDGSKCIQAVKLSDVDPGEITATCHVEYTLPSGS